MGSKMHADFYGVPNARCWKCDEQLTEIKIGQCAHCHAPINRRDMEDGWCGDCGKPLKGEEAGMGTCFNCAYGGHNYD